MRNSKNVVDFCPGCPSKGNYVGQIKPENVSFEPGQLKTKQVLFRDADGMESSSETVEQQYDADADIRLEEGLRSGLFRRIGLCTGTCVNRCPAFNQEVVGSITKQIIHEN